MDSMHNAAQSVSANLSNGGIPTGSMQTVPANRANNFFLNDGHGRWERMEHDRAWRREQHRFGNPLVQEVTLDPTFGSRVFYAYHQARMQCSNYQTHLIADVTGFHSASDEFLGMQVKIMVRHGDFPPLMDVTLWKSEASKDMIDNAKTNLRSGGIAERDYFFVHGMLSIL